MRNFLGKSKQTQAVYSFVLVDFYCFCYVSLSFLLDSKSSGEFYSKMLLRSQSHYLKFRRELIFYYRTGKTYLKFAEPKTIR